MLTAASGSEGTMCDLLPLACHAAFHILEGGCNDEAGAGLCQGLVAAMPVGQAHI